MPNWIKIAETTTNIAPGTGKAFEIDGLSIAVFNVDGILCSIDDSCPHQGSSLAVGTLEGCTVTCRSHGMKVNVTGGQKPGTGMIVRSHPLESRSDGLYIDLQTLRDVLSPVINARLDEKGEAKMTIKTATTKASAMEQVANPWGSSLDKLKEWDPKGAELLLQVGTNPWTSGVLPRKEVELIYLALNCACTNLDEAGTRRQIRAALDAGASRDEILLVLKCGVGLAVHSCSLGAPILLEEMKAADVKPAERQKPETPACDAMRAIGQWNTAWDPFYELSPTWTDQFFAFGASVYKSGVFTPRLLELISIALDASVTHMYAPGTRRHIKAALQEGATPEEIMAVLQICVSLGVQACTKGIPILAEELERSSTNQKASA